MQIAGKQVPNDPKATLKGELSYRAHGVDVNFVSRYISSRYGLADDSQCAAAYAVSDLNATYHLGTWMHLEGLTANLAATNLFNRKYIGVITVNEDDLSDVNYYAGSPRTIVGSMSYSFGGKKRS
jgi:iron complex outermembrane receptor protein